MGARKLSRNERCLFSRLLSVLLFLRPRCLQETNLGKESQRLDMRCPIYHTKLASKAYRDTTPEEGFSLDIPSADTFKEVQAMVIGFHDRETTCQVQAVAILPKTSAQLFPLKIYFFIKRGIMFELLMKDAVLPAVVQHRPIIFQRHILDFIPNSHDRVRTGLLTPTLTCRFVSHLHDR